MVFGFVEDLDDVAIGRGIEELKNIRTRRQYLSAHTRNLDWRGECDMVFLLNSSAFALGRNVRATRDKQKMVTTNLNRSIFFIEVTSIFLGVVYSAPS
jgi:CO dehydrogenase/acetyl-CoA synthase epsilon subunit